MIPPKPSSKDAVACVGDLVGGILVGCSRRPARFVVGFAPKGFGLGDVPNADSPAVKVCGVCTRHADDLIRQLEASAPESHRTEPMVFTVNELLDVWDEFFEDLSRTFGGPIETDLQFR